MSGLTQFLLARITEDEQAAQTERTLREGDPYFDDPGEAGGFERRFDPARVLAECEAKRRIVELMLDMPTQPHGDCKCRSCWTLRLLALPYADHPDYRQEWKP